MDREIIRQIKSDFFALRNGVIADRLRNVGFPYKIIFGLTIPQIEQVAAKQIRSAELAEELWHNVSTRESRLLATMVYPQDEFTAAKAQQWLSEADTVELIDLLCLNLVRNVDGAEELAFSLLNDEATSYAGMRLIMNLLVLRKLKDTSKAKQMAQKFANGTDALSRVSRQVADEIEWCLE